MLRSLRLAGKFICWKKSWVLNLFVQKGQESAFDSVGHLFLSRVEGILTDLERAVERDS